MDRHGTQTETDRHQQTRTYTDTDGQRQTETDTHGQRTTDTDTHGQRTTENDRHRKTLMVTRVQNLEGHTLILLLDWRHDPVETSDPDLKDRG